MREVSNRYLAPNSDGSGKLTYVFGRNTDIGDGSMTVHSYLNIDDPSGGAVHPQRAWSFQTSGNPLLIGTLSNLQKKVSATGASLQTDYFTWTLDSSSGNPYISQKQTLLDGGQPYQQNSYVTQILNNYGSNIRTSLFDYTNSASPIRIYETSHIADPGAPNMVEYGINRFIRDRPVNVVVKRSSTNEAGILISQSNYDETNSCDGTLPPVVPEIMHNPAFDTGRKGNKTSETTPSGTSCWMYDALGNVYKTAGPGVPPTTITTNLNSNYSVPGQIQIDGDASSKSTFQFNFWLGLTDATSPNNSNQSISYDAFGRPQTSLSPLGIQTRYYYYPDPNPDTGFFPPSTFTGAKSGQLAIVAGRHWTRTTLDGLGRTIRIESGDTTSYSNSLSIVDTQYAPCACSPTGKMSAVSQPYPTGQTPVFTTYQYDAKGRVIAVTLPEGSTTTTQYNANTTRVTDPAGKWKSTTTDVVGNIVLVTEPDPGSQASSTPCDSRALPPIAGGSGVLQTCYTYDTLEHLTNVTMPRSTATQTRTFTFDPATQALSSENHPETGLSCYFYKADSSGRGKTLLDRIVAKGQSPGASCTDPNGKTTQYTYDSYSRVTQISRSPEGAGEDICQRTNYYYDYTSLSGGNAWGRLGTSSTGDPSCTVIPAQNGNVSMQRQYIEQYSYNNVGQPTQKRLNELIGQNSQPPILRYWDLSFTYDSGGEGLPVSVTYPDTKDGTGNIVRGGYTVTYAYDLMGRQNGLNYDTSPGDGRPHLTVSGATYNAANQLLFAPILFNNVQPTSQQRTYNILNQLESVFYGGVGAYGYEYTAGQNNGQIHALHDYVGGLTTTYSYDSLKRLAEASAPGVYDQAYTYDGFGNLTAKTGTAPQKLSVDANTNRLLLLQGQGPLDGGFCYDKWGNMVSTNGVCPSPPLQPAIFAYDVANRLTGSGPGHGNDVYLYNAQNQRVAILRTDGTEQVIFYDPSGKKMAKLDYTQSQPHVIENVYFAGLLWMQGMDPGQVGVNLLKVDRLGSVRGAAFNTSNLNVTPTSTYMPFGEELNQTTSDRDKFATYTRDSATNLDYANQRYYSSVYGRFLTADPFKQTVAALDSSSWNRYSYTRGDPINYLDPSGMFDCAATFCVDVTGQPYPSSQGGVGAGGGIDNTPQFEIGVGDQVSYGGSGTLVSTFGTGQPIRAKNVSYSGEQEDLIASRLKQIKGILSSDSDCSRYLTGPEISGLNLIDALLGNGPTDYRFGHADLNTTITAAFVGTTNANGSPVFDPSVLAPTLTVNNNGAFFSSGFTVGPGYSGGTVAAQAFILLHEIAHLINAAGFRPDGSDPKIGQANDRLIDKNCAKQINGLK